MEEYCFLLQEIIFELNILLFQQKISFFTPFIFGLFVIFCDWHTHGAPCRMENINSAARDSTSSPFSSHKAAEHSLWELFALRAAQLGELNQGLSPIRTIVRPNKRNDSRRQHSQVYYAVGPVSCGALYRSRASFDISYQILIKKLQRIGWNLSYNVLKWSLLVI